LRRQRQPSAVEEIPPNELLKVVEKVIERRFGRDMYARLLQWIRTRCEEEGCERTFDYVCSYCGMRLCGLHANDFNGVIYCQLHADPECRLADVFLVLRFPNGER
jgi:hypothetical protein